MKKWPLLTALMLTSCASFQQRSTASTSERVASDLRIYDEYVAKVESEFSANPASPHDKVWVKKKLNHMFVVDQYMRHYTETPFNNQYNEIEKKEFDLAFMERFQALDRKNTEELKELLKIYPWFSISKFGKVADEQAWLLVQHADLDREFQKMVLTRLEKLYRKKETKPANYAYLYDRVAYSANDESKRVPQRYGTQGKCVGSGKWEPWESEDPKNLDKRRKSVGLGTEAEYIAVFKDICH